MGSLRITADGRDLLADGARPLVIGRDATADVRCTDPRVSRRHLVVRSDEQGWLVEDSASANGTFKDGERIERLRLSGFTRLHLGDPTTGVTVDFHAIPEQSVSPDATRPIATPVELIARAGTASPPEPAAHSELGRITGVHTLTHTVRIGRSPDNDIVVDDLLVSRQHAELRGDPSRGWELVDLGSHNGTFVNGQRISSVRLGDGDIVALGRQLFRLTHGVLEEYIGAGEVSFAAEVITERTPDGRVLLDDVSFALGPRSFLAVVGTSGAGKSTLLNALAGFKPALRGRVFYGGRDLYAWYDEMRQRIGYVPQDDILHRQLTVRRALRYAAELRFPPDVAAADRELRIDEVMAELGLSHRADLAISKLSGGQRKRTSIALELLTKPDLLFLDEPTSGLDPGYEKSLMTLLRQLADGGRTVIVITHSLQSLALCNRVLFLAPGGKVAFFGPPDEALPFFGRDDFADVFSDLEGPRGDEWQQRFRHSPIAQRYVHRPLVERETAASSASAGPEPPRPRHRWDRQLSTLLRRYVAVIASDRVNRALLVVQAPILAVIILLALGPNGFDPDNPSALRGAQLTGLFLVTGITFVGAGNAIREIVKEFPIYRRERSVGLSISAYVASKVVVLSVITVLQAAVLVLVSAARQGGPPEGAALPGPMRLELIVDIALTGLASMGLGLLISAVVKNADKAITLLPLLLVPQQVLSNPLLQIETKPVLSQLAPVSSAQWGYSAVAASVDVNRLTDIANSALPPGAEKSALQGRWNHDARTWFTDAGWLVLLLALELAATCYALKCRDPSLLGSGVPKRSVARPSAVLARA